MCRTGVVFRPKAFLYFTVLSPFCVTVNQLFLSEMICKNRVTPEAIFGSFMLRGRAASARTGIASRVCRELVACF